MLLSALPGAHEGMVRSLRSRGIPVRVPRAGAPLRAWRRRPDVILVDLVHGAGLTRSLVTALNRRRGRALVVALHEGSLEPGRGAAADLVIEGFCRSAEWERLLVALSPRPDLTGASLH